MADPALRQSCFYNYLSAKNLIKGLHLEIVAVRPYFEGTQSDYSASDSCKAVYSDAK